MIEFVAITGIVLFVLVVSHLLRAGIADKRRALDDFRRGNAPLLIIPLVFAFIISCDDVPNTASAQEISGSEPYITQADIDTLSNVVADSTGRCMSDGAYEGMKLFMKNCNGCHPAGEKGKGPSLIESQVPDFLIHFQVRQGFGDMPSFTKEQLSKEQVQKIVLFIHELRRDGVEEKTAAQ